MSRVPEFPTLPFGLYSTDPSRRHWWVDQLTAVTGRAPVVTLNLSTPLPETPVAAWIVVVGPTPIRSGHYKWFKQHTAVPLILISTDLGLLHPLYKHIARGVTCQDAQPRHVPYLLQFAETMTSHLQGRMRFGLEVTRAVRAAWPAELPLLVRISATDWAPGGWDAEQSVAFVRELAELEVDLIDVSSGGLVANATIPVGPGYQVPFAAQIRAETGVPTAAVGLIDQLEQAEAIVARGEADLVALARAELRDPTGRCMLLRRWAWMSRGQYSTNEDATKAEGDKLFRCSARFPPRFGLT